MVTSAVKGKGGQRFCPPADYGQRAASALDLLLPAPHRDKTIARLFGVSVRMAKYLRAGRHWTLARLGQASAMLGDAFDAALTPSAQHYSEMAELAHRLAQLEAWRAEILRGADARLPPQEGGSAGQVGHGAQQGSAPADRGSPRA